MEALYEALVICTVTRHTKYSSSIINGTTDDPFIEELN